MTTTDGIPDVPDLLGARVHLRRLTVEHAPGLHAAYGDPDAMRFWNAPPSRDIAETEQRICQSHAFDATWQASWAVLLQPAEQCIGMVNYHARNPRHRRLAVGWILAQRFTGQSYMREAMRLLLSHCFDALQTHRIEAEIEPDNARSVRLAERLGFRREALLRDRLYVADEPRSILMYALLRPEWNPA